MPASPSHRVLVLGGGFGGLAFCQAFRHPRASVTLVDRQNHHLFQPLLYQVATAGLSAPEIAQPLRAILNRAPNLTVLMDEIQGIDLPNRRVTLASRELPFDFLVLALGVSTSYFGHPEWAAHAPGLKSLADAMTIRANVLAAFERAEMEPDPARRRALMTLVVVGGGPTGVELAGALAELARHVLRRDFDHINPAETRILLVEASPRLLGQFPEALAENARRKLQKMGVEVLLSTRVKDLTPGAVVLEGEHPGRIDTPNVIWSAGVAAPPITRTLGVETDRAGRLKVLPDLSLPGHPYAFAIGDIVSVANSDGKPVPGVSPAAMQMGRHVARLIAAAMDNPAAAEPSSRPPFRYFDKGSMATIGRSAAIAHIGPVQLTGYPAWLAWLFVHLVFLVGFRNRLAVLLQWFYSYVMYKRGSRIIVKP